MRITVSGVVQGVGFRPFVHNLADKYGLAGYVRNDNGSVDIEVSGSAESIDSFIIALKAQAPPMASIQNIRTEPLGDQKNDSVHIQSAQKQQRQTGEQGTGFHISESIVSEKHGSFNERFVPPDTATCEQCLGELFDRANRRFRYPFINCTNCGPRFTIISSLPYDRPATTMAPFRMCDDCQHEYDDPCDRRFHAQPNACWHCGPSLTFSDRTSLEHGEKALSAVFERLSLSQIVAIKGLGGFHLVCDATDRSAVQTLRKRKKRPAKPLAIMLADMETVQSYCSGSSAELAELNSSRRPIVLLEKLENSRLAPEVAPQINRLGVMLPYTPLHHLLLAAYGQPLVFTSGNYSEEPIAIDNEEARERLSEIADCFLIHNRDIRSRYDDSVVLFVKDKKTILRRARGLAPLPVLLPASSPISLPSSSISLPISPSISSPSSLSISCRSNSPSRKNLSVLGCGGHLKNTFALVREERAFVSQHIGDLENLETEKHFEETLELYLKLFDFQPELIAHDLHPDYLSGAIAQKLASRYQCPTFAVQHHHAHIVSCMAEHGLVEPVIGVAMDGLGYGADGNLWGGEFFLASRKEYQRMAHLQNHHLPGGNQAIKQPWRMALSCLLSQSENNAYLLRPYLDNLRRAYGKVTIDTVQKQIERKINSPLTSSMGRIFDAVSALLGICPIATYEGQAATELQAIAQSAWQNIEGNHVYPFLIEGEQPPFILKTDSLVQAAYSDFLEAMPVNVVAAKFHYTLAQAMIAVCLKLRSATGINTVCLSGGVFQNDILLRCCYDLLAERDFLVFFPQALPVNDGGLSLGQAIVAIANSNCIAEQN